MDIKNGIGQPPPPSVKVDSEHDSAQDAIDEIRKKTAQVHEEKTEQNLHPSDRFAAKEQANKFSPATANTKETAAKFEEKFMPDLVKTFEQNLNTKLNPDVALKYLNSMQTDPLLQTAAKDMRIAVEQWAQTSLKNQATADANSQNQGSSGQSGSGGFQQRSDAAFRINLQTEDATANAKNKDQATADRNKDKKTFDQKTTDNVTEEQEVHGKGKGAKTQNKPQPQKPQTAPKPTDKPDKKPPLPDLKKEEAKKDGDKKDQQGAGEKANKLVTPGEVDVTVDEATLDVPAEQQAKLDALTQPPSMPVQWGKTKESGAALSASESQAATSLYACLQASPNADIIEMAAVVLTYCMNGLDDDLRAVQKELQRQQAINDLMRQYDEHIQMLIANLHSTADSIIITHEIAVLGVDDKGNLVPTMVPVLIDATSTTTHNDGSGGDLSATDAFQKNFGSEGVQEAKQNGTYRQVSGDMVVGQCSTQVVAIANSNFVTQEIQARKETLTQDMDKIATQVQKHMQIRKDVLDQFSKIIQSVSDAQDQQMALMAR